MKKTYEIPVYFTMYSKVKVDAESIKEAEKLIQEGVYNFDEVKSQAKFLSNSLKVDYSFIENMLKEESSEGFKFISEDEWYSIFKKYDSEVPCMSNSLYENRMINMYHTYDESKRSSESMEDEADCIINKIKRSRYSKYIEDVRYCMDYDCNIRLIDIFLLSDVKLNIFEEILKYMRDSFAN